MEKLRLFRVTKLSSWSSKPMPKIHSTVMARTFRERKERMPALAFCWVSVATIDFRKGLSWLNLAMFFSVMGCRTTSFRLLARRLLLSDARFWESDAVCA